MCRADEIRPIGYGHVSWNVPQDGAAIRVCARKCFDRRIWHPIYAYVLAAAAVRMALLAASKRLASTDGMLDCDPDDLLIGCERALRSVLGAFIGGCCSGREEP